MLRLHTILFLVSIARYACYQKHEYLLLDHTHSDRMCDTAHVHFQATTRNALACVRKCAEMLRCRSAVYLQGKQTCFGLTTDRPFDVAFSSLPGARFYRPTADECSSSSPLIASINGSQLSATSQYKSTYGASAARLDNAVCWTAAYGDSSQQHIQVDFLSPTTTAAVITQGDKNYDEWVTSYTISVSDDCVTFSSIPVDGGPAQIFKGSYDRSTKVSNCIRLPVVCRCFRLLPVTWNNAISLRFEVLGSVL